jgi:hypothetical protein
MGTGGNVNDQAGRGSVGGGAPNQDGEQGGEDILCGTSWKDRNHNDVGHIEGSRTTVMEGS